MRLFSFSSFFANFRLFVLALVLSLSVLLFGSFAQDAQSDEQTPRSSEEVYSDLALFGEVFDRIRAEYVDVPDERELIRVEIAQGNIVKLRSG